MAEAIHGRRSRETTHPPPSPRSLHQQQGNLTQTHERSGSGSRGSSEGIQSAPSDHSESLQFRQQQQRCVPRNAHPHGHSSSRPGGRGEGRTPRGQNLERERGQNSRANVWREKPNIPMRERWTQGEQVRVVEDQGRTFSLQKGVETSVPASSEHNVATGYGPSRGQLSENWRSGPNNRALGNLQKGSGEVSIPSVRETYDKDVEKLEGERGVVSNSSGGWNDLPQISERDSCGGWGCSKEAKLKSPSASNLGDAVADAERMHAQRGHWSADAWSISETVASGWDDVEPTTERHSPKGWDGVPYDSLNASDFNSCDSEVEILGHKVLVTVAATADVVEKWLTDHQEERKFGLDIEWRPCFQKGDYHNAAILQLSVEKHCLLVQLLFLDYFPESLKSLLADPNVMLGGVGIKADTQKLKDDHGLVCKGEVELGGLASTVFNNKLLEKAGIIALTKKVLASPYKKNRQATMSNWEIRYLTFQQIQYAAADAWLSYSILMSLLALKDKSLAQQAVAPAK